MIENLTKKYSFSKEKKLNFLGDGEWVNEPDEVIFQYKGFKCEILRVFIREPYAKEEHYFGGHLCGYVYIPKDHICFEKDYDDISIDCHGGLTYSGFYNDEYKIGFDCAHSGDYVASTEHLYKTDPQMIKIRQTYAPLMKGMEDHYLFNPKYKNVEFCIEECKRMVDQLIKIKNNENKECQEKE